MERAEIIAGLQKVIAEQLERPLPETLMESHRLYDDLGLDSIMVLQLLVYVEEAFGVEVPEEDVDPAVFETVGTLSGFIEALQAAQAV